jgi:glycosyltransferase involved in cell wall biosynthesis
VLHLAAGNLFGGVETYLLTLARLRHLCPEMEPQFGLCFPGRLRDELAVTGVAIHELGQVRASRPWTVLRARNRLKRVLQTSGIDVVATHGCWPHALFGPTVRRSAARLVNMVHDVLGGGQWVERWAARTRPDLVIANSHFTADAAGKVFPGIGIEVCYLPIAVPEFSDREIVRREVRTELGTSPDAVVILQASRLERWKGQSVLIKALTRLGNIPGWVAWIAGGPQKAGEHELLAELAAAGRAGGIADRLFFLGQRTDVPRLMAAADIYCQPNTGPEPFGIAFVEALGSNVPVVTTGLGGAAEIVTGACGVLCPPGDSDAVAAALERLIANPSIRKELGNAGRPRALELCDPARQIRELARLAGETAGVMA